MAAITRHATEEYADGEIAKERESREAAMRDMDGRVSDLADAMDSMPKDSDLAALREKDGAIDAAFAGLAARVEEVDDASVRRDEDIRRDLGATCEAHAKEAAAAAEKERLRAQGVERLLMLYLTRLMSGLPVAPGDLDALLAALEADFKKFFADIITDAIGTALAGTTHTLGSVRDIYTAVKTLLERLGADKVVGYPERFEP